MNQPQIVAILLILGFGFVLAASFVGPPRLYQEPDVNRQLELIDEHQTTWIISNVFFGLAGVVTAVGLALFSLQLRGGENAWLAVLGSAVYAIGALGYVVFLYQRAVDPAALFTDYSFSPLTVVLLAGLIIGLLLTGAAFLQAGYPVWLGIVTITGMVLIGGSALFFPTQFFNYFPPQALFLFTLIAGIVIWRQ